MDVKRLDIPDVLMLRPTRRVDDRGFFVEHFNEGAAREAGIDAAFVQDNLSFSREIGTLRGLHFQAPPHAQAKLLAVMTGKILDVAVDIRKGSPSFGRHVAVELDAESGWQLFIPKGFLHGYVTRAPDTRVFYKVDDVHAGDCDRAVLWNDPDLAIDWGLAGDIRLSPRDTAAPRFADLDSPFAYSPQT